MVWKQQEKHMKKTYKIKSSGYTHRFENVKDDLYRFFSQEDWMPISVSYESDYSNIRFIDTEGGTIISKGWHNDEIEVEDIVVSSQDILFKLKEMPKPIIENGKLIYK
jgi:hypothetical protein